METMPRVAEIIRQYYPTVTIKLYDLTEDSLLCKKRLLYLESYLSTTYLLSAKSLFYFRNYYGRDCI